MVLTRGILAVEEIKFGSALSLHGRALTIHRQGLTDFLRRDPRISQLEISLTHPGDSTRILCVKDVIEPWCKVAGEGPGEGTIHILAGMAVVTCGQIVGFQEGIIDMSGPGADLSPFSRTRNVVLEIGVVDGLTPHEHEATVREAGLAAAAFLAEAGRAAKPERLLTYGPIEQSCLPASLPRIAYLYMLLSQGLLHDSYLFGRNAKEGLPRMVAAHELMDLAITSGNCVSACDKNTTYHHQNNPILAELFARHGRDLNFVGVVVTNEPVRLSDKEASAAGAIELVKQLAPAGVIISKEGFGNPDADQMMLIRGLEQAGIRTCGLTDEYAGPDGGSQSLADVTPEADAMVSTGNANQRILLPPMTRLLGPIRDLSRLAGAYPQSLREDGSLEIELQGLLGSTNQLGATTLRCREV